MRNVAKKWQRSRAAMSNRVSLAELALSDIRLRPSEAVAIVSAICAQHIAGTLPGIPSPGVIRISRDGDLLIEGPITTASDVIARAALLLTDLLPGFEALPEYRASGALRLVIARALGSMDLPPYGSLEDFRAALARFETEDVREVARALFSAWERSSVARAFKTAARGDLTISDVRRARRATGLSLAYLSTVAEVPPRRLRDLEWGYMRDWPATAEARAQVIRYARAAGLDESIVLSVAWPMIVEHASQPRSGEPVTSTALVPSGPQELAVVGAKLVPPARRHRWRSAVIVAAAVAALLGAFAFGWRSATPVSRAHDTLRVQLSPPQSPSPAVVSDGGGSDAQPRDVRVLPIGTNGPGEPPRAEPAVPKRARAGRVPAAAPSKGKRRQSAQSRPIDRDEPRKSVLERELFRIVIR
jgi:hypothetical protein